MLNYMLVGHNVKDFTAWKGIYDSDLPKRIEAGVTEKCLFRSEKDTNEVIILFEAGDLVLHGPLKPVARGANGMPLRSTGKEARGNLRIKYERREDCSYRRQWTRWIKAGFLTSLKPKGDTS